MEVTEASTLNCEIDFTMDIEGENVSVDTPSLTLVPPTAAPSNESVQNNSGTLAVKSYREILNLAKKALMTIEDLQNQMLRIQVQFADVHFDSAILFDPEIIEMLLDSKFEKSGQKLSSLSQQNKNGEDESLEERYKEMCQKLAKYGNHNNHSHAVSDAEK